MATTNGVWKKPAPEGLKFAILCGKLSFLTSLQHREARLAAPSANTGGATLGQDRVARDPPWQVPAGLEEVLLLKPRPLPHLRYVLSAVIVSVLCLHGSSCRLSQPPVEPSIELSRVPPAGEGSPDTLYTIEGRVRGAQTGQRIVLFARAGMWWVQPLADHPFTAIQKDSRWKNSTHPGTAYAALLVDSRYNPPLTANSLPGKGGPVLAVAIAEGSKPHPTLLQFSGYQWEIRETAGDTAGTMNLYSKANTWTDQSGFLHLRIDGQAGRWTSAEVKLSRSLGYGSYRFVVRDVSHLEAAAVFICGPPTAMDIEISRWGEPEDKNAQYVIQPYVVPANTVRFTVPAGTLTHWMDWQPGRVAFKTVRGASTNVRPDVVAEHAFTSGVPSPGSERIELRLYVFDNKRNPLQHGSEVVIEKFEFRP
jgi:hypothetical protein